MHVEIIINTLSYGLAVGVVHFVAVGALYGNPLIDRVYKAAMKSDPAVKDWPSQKKYLITQFLGTQLEVFVLTIGYIWLGPYVSDSPLQRFLLLSLLFSGIRVYPRFWNMYIQSTYPNNLLTIEFINGVISTFIILGSLEIMI